MSDGQPLLYSELAGWFHLLTAPEDYEEEAEIFSVARRLLTEAEAHRLGAEFTKLRKEEVS